MLSETEYKRLYWHSRRGMLELDLLLLPFAETQLQGLDQEDLALYKALLEEEDQDLYSWLVGRYLPEQEGLRKMVAMILAHSRQTKQA